MLQIAIVLFLLGSVLCGLAQNMTQLILMRALQGLGGGGLLVVTLAVVGDVIPPAERGRYQGLFGGVFGLATVVGPLIGGLLVQHFSWRWIFYINLPLGLFALLVIGAVFQSQVNRVRHEIDFLGAGYLAMALTCIILFTSQGGTVMAWSDGQLWCILAFGLVSLGGFIYEERLAGEPIDPLLPNNITVSKLINNSIYCQVSNIVNNSRTTMYVKTSYNFHSVAHDFKQTTSSHSWP